MAKYYTFFIFLFFLIQLSIKYVRGDDDDVVTKDTVCENATLVQFTNAYQCKCHLNHVPISIKECVLKTELKKCEKESELNETCGAYAKCQKKADADSQTDEKKKYECLCETNYEKDTNIKDALHQCRPLGCKNKKCINGHCILGSDNEAMCACNIGYELEGDECKKKEKEKEKKCDLECVSPATCKQTQGIFHCSTDEAVVQAILTEEKKILGSGNSLISALSQCSIYLIATVFFIALK